MQHLDNVSKEQTGISMAYAVLCDTVRYTYFAVKHVRRSLLGALLIQLCAAQNARIASEDGAFEVRNLTISVRSILSLPPDAFASIDYRFTVANHTGRNWTAAHFYIDLIDPSGGIIGKPQMVHSTRFEISIKDGEEKRQTFNRGVRVPAGTKKSAVQIARSAFGLEGGSYEVAYSFSLTKPVENSDLQFEDQVLRISFLIIKSQIGFELMNKTDLPMKVNWNEASYVDPSGSAHKVTHGGVRIIERESAHPATTIPPTARIEDFVVPTDAISMQSGRRETKDLLPEGPEARAFEGRTFSLFMPIEVNGVLKNYLFTFKIGKVV